MNEWAALTSDEGVEDPSEDLEEEQVVEEREDVFLFPSVVVGLCWVRNVLEVFERIGDLECSHFIKLVESHILDDLEAHSPSEIEDVVEGSKHLLRHQILEALLEFLEEAVLEQELVSESAHNAAIFWVAGVELVARSVLEDPENRLNAEWVSEWILLFEASDVDDLGEVESCLRMELAG